MTTDTTHPDPTASDQAWERWKIIFAELKTGRVMPRGVRPLSQRAV